MIFKKRNSGIEKIPLERNSSILFVCYGNVCRSPMAEGMAKQILGDKIRIGSAGINPVFKGADPKAVQVVAELFGTDISTHKTRHFLSAYPEEFDHIIALDSLVYEFVKKNPKIAKERLVLWDIEDPFSKSLKVYQQTAEKIHKHILEAFIE